MEPKQATLSDPDDCHCKSGQRRAARPLHTRDTRSSALRWSPISAGRQLGSRMHARLSPRRLCSPALSRSAACAVGSTACLTVMSLLGSRQQSGLKWWPIREDASAAWKSDIPRGSGNLRLPSCVTPKAATADTISYCTEVSACFRAVERRSRHNHTIGSSEPLSARSAQPRCSRSCRFVCMEQTAVTVTHTPCWTPELKHPSAPTS